MSLKSIEPILYLPDDTPFFPSAGDEWHWQRLLWRAVGLVALAAVISIPIYFFGGFVWQDSVHFKDNPLLWSWTGLLRIWVQRVAGRYQPVAEAALWAEHHFFTIRAWRYHVVSALFHGIDGAMLWMVLRRLDVRGAWLGAALFIVHPVQVQAVAWASQQSSLIAAALVLGSVWAYLRLSDIHPPLSEEMIEVAAHEEIGELLPPEPVTRLYILSLALAGLAILTDPLGATIPLILLILIWWKRGVVDRSTWLRLAPYFVLGAIGAWISWSSPMTVFGWMGTGPALSFGQRICVASRSIFAYLLSLAWPFSLPFVYSRWPIAMRFSWQWIFPTGIVLLIIAAGALRRSKHRTLLVAALLYMTLLLPSLGAVLFNIRPPLFMADYLQYLAAAVPLAALAAALIELLGHFNLAPIVLRSTRAAAGTAILLALAVVAMLQVGIYTDLKTLSSEHHVWEATLAVDHKSVVARTYYASLLLGEEEIGQAGILIRDADLSRENDPAFLQLRAKVYLHEFRFEEAVASLRQADALDPQNREIKGQLADAYARAGQIAKAMEIYRSMLGGGHPDEAKIHNAVGTLLMSLGIDHNSDAIAEFQAAIALDPRSISPHLGLFEAYLATGKQSEAAEELQTASKLDPTNAEPFFDSGKALYELGDYSDALNMLQQAVILSPKSAEAWTDLGVVQFALKRYIEAALSFQRALDLKPDFAEARHNLDAVHRKMAEVGTATPLKTGSIVEFKSHLGSSFDAPSDWTRQDKGDRFSLRSPDGHAMISSIVFKKGSLTMEGLRQWASDGLLPKDASGWEASKWLPIEIGGQKAMKRDLVPIPSLNTQWRLYTLEMGQHYYLIILNASSEAMTLNGDVYDGIVRSFHGAPE